MTELKLKADRRLTADRGRDTHFVFLSLRAPKLECSGDRPGLQVSLVLDRSGSMATENKLGLARQAAELALARLTRKDRFSLVAYNQDVKLLMPSSAATPEALAESRRELLRVWPSGTTALFDGFLKGAEQVASHLEDEHLGKVLLLTDGLANVGLQDPAAIAEHVGELRVRGVLTSTFGVGADFNQILLQGMADAGGGHFYFVEDASQIEDLLTSEVGEALETVARDVRISVEHGSEVQVRLLDAFRDEIIGPRVVTRLGALTSEQLIELVYEVVLPARSVGEVSNLRFTVTDADGSLGELRGAIEFLYASQSAAEEEEVDADVVRRAASRVRLQASEQAYAMNYLGQRAEVRSASLPSLEFMRKLAEKDPEIAKMVAELEKDLG
ncbi:MAG: vWA domain-containing protein, partial [Gaiellaceae bacterium]